MTKSTDPKMNTLHKYMEIRKDYQDICEVHPHKEEESMVPGF